MKLIINEWRKFFHQKRISIIFPVFQLITTVGFLSIVRIFENTSSASEPDSYFLGTSQITFIYLIFFGMVCAATTITKEASSGTIKFLLTRPYNRHKIMLAKFSSIIILMVVYGSISELLNYFLQFIFLGELPPFSFAMSQLVVTIAKILVVSVFFCSFALMISALVDSSAFTTAVTFIYFTMGSPVWSLAAQFLKIDRNGWIFKLCPLQSNSYLLGLMNADKISFDGNLLITIITNLAYAFIFYLIGDFIFSKKDISLAN
ncbi:ABC transporter permease subunit [Xylocopilactobacillus apicola]|uniref:ABC transporter permease subunit n=1 Tax=Xylocopilactobacillus apicola TaxID=2932184 RepID=UPI00295297C3|nr:ABC transporter permease subunit [Xylocopilactobacillus apicola]